jgi:hypothetical protein
MGEEGENVAGITVVFGGLLVIVGAIAFVATGSSHPTALIPAALGLVFALLGGLSFKEHLRKHTMHAAAALALICVVALAIMSGPKLATLLSGGTVERPPAVIAQAVTAGLCLVFVGLCVNSFIQARRGRI